MALPDLQDVPSRVTMRVAQLLLSDDGVTFKNLGRVKNVKLTAKPQQQTSNDQQKTTQGYLVSGKWRMQQTSSVESGLLSNFAAGNLYVRILDTIANIKHDTGAILVSADDHTKDFDGGESYIDCSFQKLMSAANAATLMSGAAA